MGEFCRQVRTGGCGDGICDLSEDRCTCAADCGVPPTVELDCTDGVDDDCDGDIDCDDLLDCGLDPACNGSAVGDPCVDDGECCTNKCKGAAGRKTCK
jgi:hypothetical protein